MNNIHSPVIVFSVSGFCSGLCSGLSVILQPLGIIVPGILFGAALSHATHTSLTSLSSGQRATLIVASTGGYFIAIVASLVSMKLPGFDNGLLYSSYVGAIAGGIGALVVAGSLVVVIPELSTVVTLFIVTFTGAVLGSIFMLCGIYISDHTSFGHPFDDIVSFPLWQMGVASVIPFCRSRSAK